MYYLERLVYESAYIESILFDTPIGNEVYFEKIKKITKHANDSEKAGERLNRLRFRLDRNSVFIDYLISEYDTTRLSIYGQGLIDDIAIDLPHRIKSQFENDRKQIFKRAKTLIG